MKSLDVQVIIRHLKQQLSESKVDAEQLATFSIAQTALEAQVKQLTDDLCEAKSAQSPVSCFARTVSCKSKSVII